MAYRDSRHNKLVTAGRKQSRIEPETETRTRKIEIVNMSREKGESNGFGEDTYWNRPTQGRARKLPSKYPNLKPRKGNKALKPTEPNGGPRASRSPSPTISQMSTRTIVSPSRIGQQIQHTKIKSPEEEKDEKSIVKLMKSALPQFS